MCVFMYVVNHGLIDYTVSSCIVNKNSGRYCKSLYEVVDALNRGGA